MPAYVGHLKHRSVSALPSSNKLAMVNPAKVTDPYVPVAVTVAGLDVPDDVLIKSLPPRRRTKSNIRILKDNKALCSSDDTFSEEKDKKLASDLEVPIVLSKDSSRDVNNNNTHIGDQDFSFEGKDSLNPVIDLLYWLTTFNMHLIKDWLSYWLTTFEMHLIKDVLSLLSIF